MKLKEILNFLSEEKIAYKCTGNEDIVTISHISSLKNIKPNALCWIKNETYINDRLIEKIKEANAVIVTPFVIKELLVEIMTTLRKADIFTGSYISLIHLHFLTLNKIFHLIFREIQIIELIDGFQ